jgi:hypothetical protein
VSRIHPFLLSLVLTASCIFAASSYKITVPSDLSAGETLLKAGQYTLTLEGKMAVFKKGTVSIQIPIFVDKNTGKTAQTTLEINGKMIQAIDLGGTDLRITFRPSHGSSVN